MTKHIHYFWFCMAIALQYDVHEWPETEQEAYKNYHMTTPSQ